MDEFTDMQRLHTPSPQGINSATILKFLPFIALVTSESKIRLNACIEMSIIIYSLLKIQI